MLNCRFDTDVLPEELTFRLVDEQTIGIDDIEPLQYQPSSLHGVFDESLCESIRQVGLQSPLVVAQAPMRKHFVPIAGGNSRLQALSRLYNETGDESFSKVQCVVAEWPGMIRARLAHVVTNQIHIRHSFASRAIAIVHIVESELSGKAPHPISQRDAVQLLTSNGYPISQSTFGYMEYLVSRLRPNISTELLNALSKKDVSELRESETYACGYWQDKAEPSVEFDEFFARLLEEAGSVSSDVNELIERVRYKASDLSEQNHSELGSEPDYTTFVENGPSSSTEIQYPLDRGGSSGEQAQLIDYWESKDEPTDDSNVSDRCETPQLQTASGKRRKVVVQLSMGELREAAWSLASQLCNRYGLNECIIKLHEKSGYQVVSKPGTEPSMIECRLWEYLDVFAGSDNRPLSVNLWSEIDDDDWRALTELWDVVREIRKNKHADPSISLRNHEEAQHSPIS